MSETCISAAAYVLGALSPDERASFEEHLEDCAECRRAVRELAGVPGLLSRVSPADLADPPPAPDTLLPRLLRQVHQHNRRRRWAVGLAAAAAVAAAVFSTVQLTGTPEPGPLVAMHQVFDVPISARVSVTPESGGSKLWMTCHYRGQEPWDHPYVLVVTDHDGARHRLATWRVGPDGNASVTASVDLPPSQIAAVELTTMDGQTLLRLRHPA
jgi:hypothetical protein